MLQKLQNLKLDKPIVKKPCFIISAAEMNNMKAMLFNNMVMKFIVLNDKSANYRLVLVLFVFCKESEAGVVDVIVWNGTSVPVRSHSTADGWCSTRSHPATAGQKPAASLHPLQHPLRQRFVCYLAVTLI